MRYLEDVFIHKRTRSYCELNFPSMSASMNPPISVPSELLKRFTTLTCLISAFPISARIVDKHSRQH
jgi:hypothetical protein